MDYWLFSDFTRPMMLPSMSRNWANFTSLTKEAFPVIRYRTGDIAALMHEPCACGRTLVRMTRVKGRVVDQRKLV